jgi:hypothetical protein
MSSMRAFDIEPIAMKTGNHARTTELGELAPFALELSERGLQAGLERAGDKAVLRFAGVELALHTTGFELGVFDREPLAVQALLVLTLELADRLRAGAHAGIPNPR